jgi:hypothetical protein
MKIKVLGALTALVLAAPVMAATCSSTKSLGNMGPPDKESFGRSFNSGGNYLDCYTFSLTAAASSFGGTLEKDYSSKLSIDVLSVSLFSNGVSGGSTGAFIMSDTDPAKFDFGSLAAGTYTLAVSSKVSGKYDAWSSVKYTGWLETKSAAIASPAPEPQSLAMMLAGLVGVGAVVRRRRQG